MLVFAGGFVYELNRQGIQIFGKILYKETDKVCFSAAIAPVEIIEPHDCLLFPSGFLALLGAFYQKCADELHALPDSPQRLPAGRYRTMTHLASIAISDS
mgnify:CR=1 FL=1